MVSHYQPGGQSTDPWSQRQRMDLRQMPVADDGRAAYGLAVAFTILGYVASCLFSLAAIWQINKAERAGYDMYGWRIANWIGLMLGAISTIIFVMWLIIVIF
jgi:hypothetical protein